MTICDRDANQSQNIPICWNPRSQDMSVKPGPRGHRMRLMYKTLTFDETSFRAACSFGGMRSLLVSVMVWGILPEVWKTGVKDLTLIGPTSFCQTPIEKRQCVRSLSPALLTNNEELVSLQPSQQTPFGEVWWWGSIGNEQSDSFYSAKTFPVNFGFGIVVSV